MARLPFIRKAIVRLAVIFASIVLLALVATRVQQWLLRRDAERLLSEVQAIELRQTTWGEAQQIFQHWTTQREVEEPCDERKCAIQVTLNNFVFRFIARATWVEKVDGYLRYRLKLSGDSNGNDIFMHSMMNLLRAYMWMGGRPTLIRAEVGMRDGVVWSKGFSVRIETRGRVDPEGPPYDYSLIGSSGSAARLGKYDPNSIHPALLLHREYMIGRPDGCHGCVLGWSMFTPYADHADVRRLTEFNLACVTDWHPCRDQGDLMPAAWQQYVAEAPRVQALWEKQSCSSEVIELLGREAPLIATGEVIAYRKQLYSNGSPYYFAKVHFLEPLKRAPDQSVNGIRELKVSNETIQFVLADGATHPELGARFIFVFGNRSLISGPEPELVDRCAIIPKNESNLSLIKRGIARDPYAGDAGPR